VAIRGGAVVIWSAGAPQLVAFEIPAGGSGLMIGRDLIGTDDRISASHVRILATGNRLLVHDLGSRNGTRLDGQRLVGPNPYRTTPPTLLRIGRTLLLLVDDVTPYLGRSLTTRFRLTVGVSLLEPCRILDEAILEEAHVAIVGPRWVARALGRGYLASRDGGIEIDAARHDPLESTLAAANPHTVLLESPDRLDQRDLQTLRNWLETDVRFVTCFRRRAELDALTPEISRWLCARTIEIPEPRFDELPSVIHTAVERAAAGITVHASAIEETLLALATGDEDAILQRFGDALRDFLATGELTFRGGIFERPEDIGFPVDAD